MNLKNTRKKITTMCPGGELSLAAVDVRSKADFKDVKRLGIIGVKKDTLQPQIRKCINE